MYAGGEDWVCRNLKRATSANGKWQSKMPMEAVCGGGEMIAIVLYFSSSKREGCAQLLKSNYLIQSLFPLLLMLHNFAHLFEDSYSNL